MSGDLAETGPLGKQEESKVNEIKEDRNKSIDPHFFSIETTEKKLWVKILANKKADDAKYHCSLTFGIKSSDKNKEFTKEEIPTILKVTWIQKNGKNSSYCINGKKFDAQLKKDSSASKKGATGTAFISVFSTAASLIFSNDFLRKILLLAAVGTSILGYFNLALGVLALAYALMAIFGRSLLSQKKYKGAQLIYKKERDKLEGLLKKIDKKQELSNEDKDDIKRYVSDKLNLIDDKYNEAERLELFKEHGKDWLKIAKRNFEGSERDYSKHYLRYVIFSIMVLGGALALFQFFGFMFATGSVLKLATNYYLQNLVISFLLLAAEIGVTCWNLWTHGRKKTLNQQNLVATRKLIQDRGVLEPNYLYLSEYISDQERRKNIRNFKEYDFEHLEKKGKLTVAIIDSFLIAFTVGIHLALQLIHLSWMPYLLGTVGFIGVISALWVLYKAHKAYHSDNASDKLGWKALILATCAFTLIGFTAGTFLGLYITISPLVMLIILGALGIPAILGGLYVAKAEAALFTHVNGGHQDKKKADEALTELPGLHERLLKEKGEVKDAEDGVKQKQEKSLKKMTLELYETVSALKTQGYAAFAADSIDRILEEDYGYQYKYFKDEDYKIKEDDLPGKKVVFSNALGLAKGDIPKPQHQRSSFSSFFKNCLPSRREDPIVDDIGEGAEKKFSAATA